MTQIDTLTDILKARYSCRAFSNRHQSILLTFRAFEKGVSGLKTD